MESKKIHKEQRSCRFVFQMNEALHKEIKVAAALRNMSMSLIMHKALYQYLRREIKEENPPN